MQLNAKGRLHGAQWIQTIGRCAGLDPFRLPGKPCLCAKLLTLIQVTGIGSIALGELIPESGMMRLRELLKSLLQLFLGFVPANYNVTVINATRRARADELSVWREVSFRPGNGKSEVRFGAWL